MRYQFPITGLNNKQVKHMIVEIYDATKNEVIKYLASEIKNAPIPLASLNVDLWTSKISSELTYIAILVVVNIHNTMAGCNELLQKRFLKG